MSAGVPPVFDPPRHARSPQPSCPDLFRASTSLRRLAPSRCAPRCRKTWMPGTSPGMTVGGRQRGDAGVPRVVSRTGPDDRPSSYLDKPPLFFVPGAAKTRGWSASADHDGGGKGGRTPRSRDETKPEIGALHPAARGRGGRGDDGRAAVRGDGGAQARARRAGRGRAQAHLCRARFAREPARQRAARARGRAGRPGGADGAELHRLYRGRARLCPDRRHRGRDELALHRGRDRALPRPDRAEAGRRRGGLPGDAGNRGLPGRPGAGRRPRSRDGGRAGRRPRPPCRARGRHGDHLHQRHDGPPQGRDDQPPRDNRPHADLRRRARRARRRHVRRLDAAVPHGGERFRAGDAAARRPGRGDGRLPARGADPRDRDLAGALPRRRARDGRGLRDPPQGVRAATSSRSAWWARWPTWCRANS